MMKDGTTTSEVALPYAKALMDVAQANQVADQVGSEVADLLTLLESSDELRSFLANPLVDAEAKKAVLRQITEGQVNPFLLNFLMILVDRNRVVYLEDVLSQYQVLLRALNRSVLADVITAVDLSEQQRSQIQDRVKGLTGANSVDLVATIDPSLLGGVIVKVGSQVIDASLRTQLRRIGMQLTATA
jgi:F-type H+-transporting ATPase subunit delta